MTYAAHADLHAVTGAFGFTGRHIAQRLLDAGLPVRTLTAHPDRARLPGPIEIAPLQFEDPRRLAADLTGVRVLYNTYWIRFPRGATTYASAVRNSLTLLNAAQDAGVERIVHVSIANCDEMSPFEYFRGKAHVEQGIRDSSLSHAILRPAVLFGDEGILINNIAWLLRRFPIFPIAGSGSYRLQPIFVDDLADLAVSCGAVSASSTMDAIGPETLTFNELVALVADVLRRSVRVLHVRPGIALALSRVIGGIRRDVILTRDELDGLMSNMLVTWSQPSGRTKLSEWLRQNPSDVGREYQSELSRHYRASTN